MNRCGGVIRLLRVSVQHGRSGLGSVGRAGAVGAGAG